MKEEDIFNFEDLFKGSGGLSGPSMLQATLIPFLLMPKPFGMVWEDDLITGFLVKRGYKILRVPGENGEVGEITVAVKEDDSTIPEESNIIPVFERELQDLILKALLKIAGEDK